MDGASFADCNNKLSICDSNCEDAYDSCVTGPNANHATCVANYASCSGKLPTLKRNQADSCDTQFDQCRGEKGANLSTCVSKQATCESNCEDGYNSCVTAPDANMSTCNATYAKCAGHIRGQ
ncbi:hypothetical protein F4780DRAFT_766269 [Xylariomycetidae sp. FL0641]|nr:hypothetical protein F4780DRAFT_766269 [Xylariomycetidae sp. FL0641]